ncbi:MAG: M14 family zinc carboxypeptidase [Oceanicaulis sp.]
MKKTLARLAAACAAFGLSAAAHAEPTDFFKVDGVRYDPSVATFESGAGYEIGERPVRYDDMLAYLRTLAVASPRIEVETIGYSHERRPILTFTVTSPENHARIDEIRETHLARLRGEAAPDAAPMVLWINFGVHGAESSGMDAAIPLLYHFAAAQGEAVEAKLDDAVMLFTVAFNPDGHTRRIDHTERFWSYADNTDPNDIAHDLWVTARTNHYWFDLNRQWLLLTQPESQAWIRKWHEWKPMVSADYHEMGSDSPFYFHPGEPLRRNPLIPARARELTFEIGRRHAAFLDSESRLYSTQEVFDNFYIGKGSTYPQINGSLGILFEAGAARGGAIQTERGLVEHADNVRTQFRTALTTLEGSLDLRSEITAYQREFFAGNLSRAQRADQQGWVFTAPGDPERARRFVRLLRMHDIEVYENGRDIRADGKVYLAGQSWFVPTAQLQHAMIRGIFDRLTEFEENIFYDVSGWTLPLAYDLDYAPVRAGLFQAAPARLDLADGAFTPAPEPDEAPYAYVFDWGHTYAPRALNRVLGAGVLARGAKEAFNVDTTTGEAALDRGAIVVPLAGQTVGRDEIHQIMRTIAAEDGVTVHAATSGLTPVEGRDLGAWNVFEALEAPKVVLAIDDGLSWYDAGEIWWTLDYRHRMPATLVKKSDLGRLDWSEYTHLLLVGGDADLPERAQETLERWIRGGGTLVAMTDAARWAETAFFEDDGEDAEKGPDDAEDETVRRYDVSEMNVREAEHVIGGAIFEADLDTSHPLGFGYRDRFLPVHRNETFTLRRPEDPYAVPVQYADAPLLTGYASDKRIGEIAGTPAVVTRRLGGGSVILMADNPVFRGTYPGTEKLLMNAIFFSGMIDAARGEYEE